MKQGFDFPGVSVGALIFNEQEQILLNKRSQNCKNSRGHWEAPGGAVNFGEKREDAIKREVKEEFGVDIEILKELHVVDEILKEEKQHWVATTFVAKIKNGEVPKIMEPEKCDGIGWFDLNNLPSPLSYITKIDLEEYERQLKKN